MASYSSGPPQPPFASSYRLSPDDDDDNDDYYCRSFLSPEIVQKLEAGAFQSLCRHLQERSDQVPNIELMTLGGFCRNCLAKWMVLEARRMVDEEGAVSSSSSDTSYYRQALDAFGYEEAARHVYGMTYGEWKKRHQKKATDLQLLRYQASAPLQAVHNQHMLETRAQRPTTAASNTSSTSSNTALLLSSNVCCENVEDVHARGASQTTNTSVQTRSERVGPFQPPPLPDRRCFTRPLVIGILTVSDRAFRNEYESGDLSGPAVETEVQTILQTVCPAVISTAIVADEITEIEAQLVAWSEEAEYSSAMDVILTTGGTGMSLRDVTPEATRSVLSVECPGLMNFVLAECALQYHQPLASLSRATAGIRNQTVIANLPGNPRGVSEVVPLLLPLLLHVVVDLQGGGNQSSSY